jgi:hypothetical protein
MGALYAAAGRLRTAAAAKIRRGTEIACKRG